MRSSVKHLAGLAAVLLLIVISGSVAHGQAQHVRWDIVSLIFGMPNIANPNGVAFASTRFPPAGVASQKIKFTGAGTFVAPASGGPSNAVTGGGTWETFNCPPAPAACVSTGSGTYWVTGMVSWQFANFQLPINIDNIDPSSPNANGNAVLRIRYSDGSEGMLGIGCHGPGAPPGIVEGVIATKDSVTYWDAAAPVAGVDENRTTFHIQ